jgi:dynein heavy chain, axonemal
LKKKSAKISKIQVESHLEEYNNMTTNKMNLVCFLYMLEHLSRVARVVRTPGGNALLVGVGGSGRQSCTRLAGFMADYQIFQIVIMKGYDLVAFREDMKKLLTQSGGKFEPTVFLFTDSQIKEESFVEDINNLLNSSEIPNLFAADEKMNICELVRPSAKQEGELELNSLRNYSLEAGGRIF